MSDLTPHRHEPNGAQYLLDQLLEDPDTDVLRILTGALHPGATGGGRADFRPFPLTVVRDDGGQPAPAVAEPADAEPDSSVTRLPVAHVADIGRLAPVFASLEMVDDALFRIYLALEDTTDHYAPDDHPSVVVMKRMDAFDMEEAKARLQTRELSRAEALNWFGDAMNFMTELTLMLRPIMNRMDIRENRKNNGRSSSWTARVKADVTGAVQGLRGGRSAVIRYFDETVQGRHTA
ncbi:hypothetical protein [Streptomyces sp. NPDC020965]|uniref:hypothetical protein n=1 Tax=Streptomyces sp. NPDC020965 TaxID=3365105 RepID=UPI003791B385